MRSEERHGNQEAVAQICTTIDIRRLKGTSLPPRETQRAPLARATEGNAGMGGRGAVDTRTQIARPRTPSQRGGRTSTHEDSQCRLTRREKCASLTIVGSRQPGKRDRSEVSVRNQGNCPITGSDQPAVDMCRASERVFFADSHKGGDMLGKREPKELVARPSFSGARGVCV